MSEFFFSIDWIKLAAVSVWYLWIRDIAADQAFGQLFDGTMPWKIFLNHAMGDGDAKFVLAGIEM